MEKDGVVPDVAVEKPRPAVPVKAEPRPKMERPDLREEVIDPSFDFEGPKMDPEDF